jgi:hypothetical protein
MEIVLARLRKHVLNSKVFIRVTGLFVKMLFVHVILRIHLQAEEAEVQMDLNHLLWVRVAV